MVLRGGYLTGEEMENAFKKEKHDERDREKQTRVDEKTFEEVTSARRFPGALHTVGTALTLINVSFRPFPHPTLVSGKAEGG